MMDMNPVELYFENNEHHSKEAVDELIKAYNGNIIQLSEDYNQTGEDEPKNHQILVDTTLDLMNRLEDGLRSAIERAEKIKSAKDTTAQELYELKKYIIEEQDANIGIYMVDVMLNNNELFPKEVTEEQHELEQLANNSVDDAIGRATQDDLTLRSIQIRKMASEISREDSGAPKDERHDAYHTAMIMDYFLYYKLKTEAFEEKYYNPSDIFEQKTWNEMSHMLFEKPCTKEEILKDMLLTIDSFENRVKFVEFLLKDYEPYLSNRKPNMEKLMDAFADMAEYEIGRVRMKLCGLIEADNFKASMALMCRRQYEEIESGCHGLSSNFRYVYDVKDDICDDRMFNIGKDQKIGFSYLFELQTSKLFPEIAENYKEEEKFRKEYEEKYPHIKNIFVSSKEKDEFYDRVREFEKERTNILCENKDRELRGIESIFEY